VMGIKFDTSDWGGRISAGNDIKRPEWSFGHNS
jgi:hypothetical protein